MQSQAADTKSKMTVKSSLTKILYVMFPCSARKVIDSLATTLYREAQGEAPSVPLQTTPSTFLLLLCDLYFLQARSLAKEFVLSS
jgi:hypothetical protein